MQTYGLSRQTIIEQATPYRNMIERSMHHILHDGSVGHFSERHIQCIWFDPALRPKHLISKSGEEVIVLDPGRWNREAGPDFLDASLLIKPAQRRLQGDIEIHVHPADWERHAHADDPRYQRVIAHITFFPGLASPAKLPPGTIEVSLETALRKNTAFRMESIDTSAYPFAARIPECACGMLLKEHTCIDPTTLLHAAGCYRFEQKIHAMTRALQHNHIDNILYHKTMATLGYKQHTKAFARLAAQVPLETLQCHPPLAAYAILLGSAGLLPATLPPAAPEENHKFLRLLWDVWWKQQAATPAHEQIHWNGPAGRPDNQPARRLAAAAVLFATPQPWALIMKALRAPKQKQAIRHLFEPPDTLRFWLHHINIEHPAIKSARALMGNNRIAAWINNVILPLAAAAGTPIEQLQPLFMPEQQNAITRQTAARLLGRDHNPALYRASGLLQQGLIQIFQDFCCKGCADCALADALQQGTFRTKPGKAPLNR